MSKVSKLVLSLSALSFAISACIPVAIDMPSNGTQSPMATVSPVVSPTASPL